MFQTFWTICQSQQAYRSLRSEISYLSTIGKVTGSHPGLLAMRGMSRYKATVALVDLGELLEEGLDGSWRRS
jgi:hypothetical protein